MPFNYRIHSLLLHSFLGRPVPLPLFGLAFFPHLCESEPYPTGMCRCFNNGPRHGDLEPPYSLFFMVLWVTSLSWAQPGGSVP